MPIKLKSTITDPPKKGRIVAFYGDGSGAALFYVRKNGVLVNAEGELIVGYTADEWLFEAGYSEWAELPDNFRLWFEQVTIGP